MLQALRCIIFLISKEVLAFWISFALSLMFVREYFEKSTNVLACLKKVRKAFFLVL